MGGCNRHRLRCDGKVLILKVAEPGETLGLSAVIGGTRYELTAETSEPCQVKFIGRMVLLKLIERYGELGLHSAQALSREFQSAYRDIHGLVLSRSLVGKNFALLVGDGLAINVKRVLGMVAHAVEETIGVGSYTRTGKGHE
jgi:CRP/FNR family transcriptional regulator, cyclic AMP receptor protein